jgi:DNA-binding response OmpR family regulator
MTRVLLVEDSELLMRVIDDTFKAEGYETITAEDGEIALRKFIEEKPDLVVTDCLIPKMDGFKLVKNIREFEAPNRTPVVMISAIYRKANYRQVALDAGADLYLFKPTTPQERQEFMETISNFLQTVERSTLSSELPRI